MPEGMCRPIQSKLLQDRLQLPLDEVVGVQATTFCAQEKWLVGIPPLDVERRSLGKLRRKSEESLLAVLRPLQLAGLAWLVGRVDDLFDLLHRSSGWWPRRASGVEKSTV